MPEYLNVRVGAGYMNRGKKTAEHKTMSIQCRYELKTARKKVTNGNGSKLCEVVTSTGAI